MNEIPPGGKQEIDALATQLGLYGVSFHVPANIVPGQIYFRIQSVCCGELYTEQTVESVNYLAGFMETYPPPLTFYSENGCSNPQVVELNFDCEYNVVDVVSMVSLVLQAELLTDEEILMSDMNGDGALNVVDVVLLVNIILDD